MTENIKQVSFQVWFSTSPQENDCVALFSSCFSFSRNSVWSVVFSPQSEKKFVKPFWKFQTEAKFIQKKNVYIYIYWNFLSELITRQWLIKSVFKLWSSLTYPDALRDNEAQVIQRHRVATVVNVNRLNTVWCGGRVKGPNLLNTKPPHTSLKWPCDAFSGHFQQLSEVFVR